MRIIFMGSPDFAVPTLKALFNAGHDIIRVYSQPPRIAGRGQKQRLTAVHEAAISLNLEVQTPLNFYEQSEINNFKNLNADIAVVIAYGLILPTDILNAPRLGAINLHASLLPRWRGAAPIQRAIMSGDTVTGVALMRMEKGLDTGPIYQEIKTEISDTTTAEQLHDELSQLSAKLLLTNIDNLEKMIPRPQQKEGIVYAQKIQKSEAQIDWKQKASDIQRHIHGLTPFPGAWSSLNNERVKFHQVEIINRNGQPGEILDLDMTIATGEHAIRPLFIQRAGKKILPHSEVLKGWQFNKNERWEYL